jgi:peptide/nickel transport system permease protein
MAYAFGGSVVIERVFSWPGLGTTMWNAVTVNDYPLAQGAFLTIGIIVIVMNYFADVASVYIDPRTAEESAH